MSNSFEKSVKGGTKVKLAAPKSKYVEHILVATNAGDAGVAEVFRTLTHRLRDSTWTIVFKALIIVHLMVREGEPNVTLRFVSETPSKMAISTFSDGQLQGGNIRHYHNYLMSRAKAYRDTKSDWVREGKGRLKRQTIEKGLLRECEIVQKQISALLRCDLFDNEPENEISLTAFRLLTMDLLVLYHVMNEGVINVLEHYFEMSKVDAERALAIYKTFSRQTAEVVAFLSNARRYEHATRLEIPKLKHAPTSLTGSLEEYLHDPDFEVNRRQYLAQQEAKRTGKFTKGSSKDVSDGFSKLASNNERSTAAFPTPQGNQTPTAKPEYRGPAPDLIDFFESIEQNQQPMSNQNRQQIPNLQTIPQYQFQQQSFPSNMGKPQQIGNFGQNTSFGQIAAPQQQSQTEYGPQIFNSFEQAQQAQQQQPFNSNSLSIVQHEQQGLFQSQQQPPSFNVQQQTFGGVQPQQPFNPANQQSPFNAGQQQHQIGHPVQARNLPTSQTQSTNPFRQSMMPQQTGSGSSPFSSPPPASSMPNPNRQSTNPFSPNMATQNFGQLSPFNSAAASSPFFSAPPAQLSQAPTQSTPPPMQPTRTGTNPFARSTPSSNFQSATVTPLVAHQTGTNPFRQSVAVNQQTGQGWQANQGTIGGLENLTTFPVFPRPATQPQQSQQPWS